MEDQTRPRIEPLPRASWTPEVVEALGALADSDHNVFGTLVRHPALFRRYSVFGAHILGKSTLPPRDRELAILRVSYRRGCEYEFAQHCTMSAWLGFPEELPAAVLEGPSHRLWSEHEAAILRAVDELVDGDVIEDPTWAVLAGSYDEHQLLDLLFTVGTYSMVAWVVRSCGVQLDSHLTGHPWPSRPNGC